jgi:hypothetical protein
MRPRLRAAKYLAREDIGGAMNAVARQPIHSLAVEASEASLGRSCQPRAQRGTAEFASSTQSRKRIIPSTAILVLHRWRWRKRKAPVEPGLFRSNLDCRFSRGGARPGRPHLSDRPTSFPR